MILLNIDPKVSEALSLAFPKPKNSAKRALDKYVRILEAMIGEALRRGQNNKQRLLNHYSISTHALQNAGGQIGANKIRVHKWLETNNLSLIKVVEQGSNITGKVSEVKLTSLVTMQNLLTLPSQAIQGTAKTITAAIETEEQKNLKLFYQLYPEFKSLMSKTEILNLFDPVVVDTASLTNYINWLSNKATKLSIHTKNTYTNQALEILRIALVADGMYFQRKKPSFFGRNYYSGTSVQNVNKELRRAILGDCYEYDIASSATSWKMGFANEIISIHFTGQSIESVFGATLFYLKDKKTFIDGLRLKVFTDTCDEKEDFQKNLLKEALNAIGFGARLRTQGWKEENGNWTNPAIVEIIKNQVERDRFVNEFVIKKFIAEQDILDKFLIDGVIFYRSDLTANPELHTASGRLSKSKVIAFLYQHGETHVMDIVRQVAAQRGRKSLANVHDAIFFKRKLSSELKQEIEYEMRFQTGNPYWKLVTKELEGYKAIISNEEDEFDIEDDFKGLIAKHLASTQ